MKIKLYSFLLLLAGISAEAQDSSRVSQLNGITVTAVKGPQKASETGKVITILSHEYLQQNSGKSIASILNEQAGLVINAAENTRGSAQDVYMRGATNGNALILVDGLPVNDASQIANTFDLNFITPDMVERIEILRGSQSTLYGSNAVTGVINIITRKAGDKKLGLGVNVGYGSYKDRQVGVSLHGHLQNFSYLLGYRYEKTAGFSDAYDSTRHADFDKDGFNQRSVFVKLGLQAGERWTLQYLFNWSQYNHDLDEGSFLDDKDYSGKFRYLLNGFSSEYKFRKGSWHILYSYQDTRRELTNDSADIAPGPWSRKYDFSRFTSSTHNVESYVNWDINDKLRLIGGGAFTTSRNDQYNNTLPKGLVTPYTVRISDDSAHTNQTSVYASLLLYNMNGFNLEAGGRLNYHSIYGNNQTFSINPSYLINNRHKLFINISSAYRVPSLYQLYATPYGNKDLKPELTTSYEAGYQATVAHDAVDFRITGFARNTHDLIIFYFNPVTFEEGYRNADKQKAYGVEVEGNWRITRDLDLTLNYTYVDGRITQRLENKSDTSYYNLYRIPKHALNATLGYHITPALYTSVTYKYTGQRYQGPTPMGDYYTLDLYGEYKFGNLLKIFAGFRNITDYQYFDILGYNSRRFNFNTGIIFNL
ncbi:MAG TPA: TonB-dependent receptor [Chitinophaga sp.]|uniref:TonB-dependent receptor plug domain-containing protein n=1 Tax=Chitinophaga sp. TaxID=1869181 RepID=UPI002CE3A57D|nr:TonB-dependent receptor [Chitinophaga sp.]HVI45434.1 TonB-dependent receptor [Chitinophaga sp.]